MDNQESATQLAPVVGTLDVDADKRPLLRITTAADLAEQQFLITFRALAQRIPAGHRFTSGQHCAEWCRETYQTWMAGYPTSQSEEEVAERIARVARRMWCEIATANLETDPRPQGEFLLDRAILAQRWYRKNGA